MKRRFVLLMVPILIWGASCGKKIEDLEKGKIGSLTWTRTDKTLTISGTGAIPDYRISPTENLPPWFESRNDFLQVIIGDGVSEIGNFAFFRFEKLTYVTMGNSVTSIGVRAFSGCSSLTSVIIPGSVTTIGNGTFSGCSSLTSITFPNSVITIGDACFYQCENLNSVIISNSVISIGESAFWDCEKLTSVTIGNSVTSIGDDAFHNCSGLTEIINYQETPQSIDTYVFSGVSKTKCTLYVPAGSESDYRNAKGWKSFVNIKPIQ